MNQPRQPLFPPDPNPDQMRRCCKKGCRELNPPDAEFCCKCGRALERPGPHAEIQGMEISLGRSRRVWGWVAWAVLVAVVAGVLVMLFVQFTASLKVALALVTFMLAYMAVMSWVTMRKSG